MAASGDPIRGAMSEVQKPVQRQVKRAQREEGRREERGEERRWEESGCKGKQRQGSEGNREKPAPRQSWGSHRWMGYVSEGRMRPEGVQPCERENKGLEDASKG